MRQTHRVKGHRSDVNPGCLHHSDAAHTHCSATLTQPPRCPTVSDFCLHVCRLVTRKGRSPDDKERGRSRSGSDSIPLASESKDKSTVWQLMHVNVTTVRVISIGFFCLFGVFFFQLQTARSTCAPGGKTWCTFVKRSRAYVGLRATTRAYIYTALYIYIHLSHRDIQIIAWARLITTSAKPLPFLSYQHRACYPPVSHSLSPSVWP